MPFGKDIVRLFGIRSVTQMAAISSCQGVFCLKWSRQKTNVKPVGPLIMEGVIF